MPVIRKGVHRAASRLQIQAIPGRSAANRASAVAKTGGNPLVLWHMPTVGEQLRAAREARKLQVQEVAQATNMRTDHVIALEEGNYAPFPAPVYIRGSVRTYAKLLKLDVMPIMEALAAEMSREGQPEQASHRVHRRRGIIDFLALQVTRLGWKRAILLVVVLTVLALIFMIRGSGSGEPDTDPLEALPPPTYQPANSSAGGYLPLPGTNR